MLSVRVRDSSDRAREKNLTRCLLGRFRGFAQSILFSILSNRTVVILANDVVQNREKVKKTVRALSLLIPGVEHSRSVEEWRESPLRCHHLPQLKIVGMSAALCSESEDTLWTKVTMIQFDDCILFGPNPSATLKAEEHSKSFVHRMLFPRKRFKTHNLFYRYLSRMMLEMSLHVWLFYYISQQNTVNIVAANEGDGHCQYYMALLETLQFSCGADIDIAKHWCAVMQRQLYRLSRPIRPLVLKGEREKELNLRDRLLDKHGRRPPPVVRLCGL